MNKRKLENMWRENSLDLLFQALELPGLLGKIRVAINSLSAVSAAAEGNLCKMNRLNVD